MKNFIIILLCLVGYSASAQNTLSFSGEQELDRSYYPEDSYFHKDATNKYSTSCLARKGNDVVYVIESTKHISYLYVQYNFSNNHSDLNDDMYQSSEKSAYSESYDATTGKYTMLVNLGDYREFELNKEHYITTVYALIQYQDQPKDYNLVFVSEK